MLRLRGVKFGLLVGLAIILLQFITLTHFMKPWVIKLDCQAKEVYYIV